MSEFPQDIDQEEPFVREFWALALEGAPNSFRLGEALVYRVTVADSLKYPQFVPGSQVHLVRAYDGFVNYLVMSPRVNSNTTGIS